MTKPVLEIATCSFDAARHAVTRWHYSRTMPTGKIVKIGAWENGRFIGCVLFSRGAGPQLHLMFNLKNIEVCELTRVALRSHETPVSKIVAVALRQLKQHVPGMRVVVSYADPEQGHLGRIYQAGNWFYLGPTKPTEHFEIAATGKRVHSKTLRTGRRGYATKLLAEGAIKSIRVWKHKYIYPLDKQMRLQLEPLRRPYPKPDAPEV